MNRTAFILALAMLGTAAVRCPVPAAAQASTPREQQSFDYTPSAGEKSPKMSQAAAETTYEDAEIVNHPIYGTLILSKHRWKDWVARALFLVLINIALMAITISLSRTEEYNLIISYILSGASFTLSFWVFLCAILLFRLKSMSWLYILPASFLTAGAAYLVLMKIKRSDVSFSELKESFKKMTAASHEDPRLVSVDGSPAEWPEQDFLR